MSSTAYTSRVMNWSALVSGAVCATVLIVWDGTYHHPWRLPIAVAIIALPYVAMTSLRTTAGPSGVVVRHGLLGFPRYRYPAKLIAWAEVIDVPPSRIGISWSSLRGFRWRAPRSPAAAGPPWHCTSSTASAS